MYVCVCVCLYIYMDLHQTLTQYLQREHFSIVFLWNSERRIFVSWTHTFAPALPPQTHDKCHTSAGQLSGLWLHHVELCIVIRLTWGLNLSSLIDNVSIFLKSWMDGADRRHSYYCLQPPHFIEKETEIKGYLRTAQVTQLSNLPDSFQQYS